MDELLKILEWKLSRLRESTKRDFSTAQTDTFAGAKVQEKASVCFGRNDKFVMMLTAGTTLYQDGATRTTLRLTRLRERTKRDFSTAQTDTFAGAKVEEKASVCFGPACGKQAK